jgi:Tol biopolymer transport system component
MPQGPLSELELSRDGRWMAYVSSNHSLWRSKLDGSEALRLTFEPWTISAPRWSPDGRRIAFRALARGSTARIWLASSGGGQLEELLPGDTGDEHGFPSWSADGKSIVFGGIPIPSRKNAVDIRVVDLATRHVTVLPKSKDLWTPRWSPDGRSIAAVKVAGCGLILFDLPSQTWRERGGLADECINDLRWSTDGQYLYFDTNSTEPGIYRLKVTDRSLEKVVSLKDARGRGRWMGLDPLDAPLVQRFVGSQEIYALDLEE